MKRVLTGLIFLFSAGLLSAQDTVLVSVPESADKSIDERINEQVEPISSWVEDIVFYDIPVKKEVVFNEVITKGYSQFTKEAPFEFHYDKDSEIPFDQFFTIQAVSDTQYELSYPFTTLDRKEYKVIYHPKFGEVVTIDGFSFSVTPVEGANTRGIFKAKVSQISIPIVLIWLILGAIVFTFYFRFVNVRRFKLAIDVVRGKYTDPKESGEVSHFQALTTALSATVGLGNIAGVAIAISLGGPGATFWMILAGILGMSSKFVECTLGVKYRKIDERGVVHGGPMYYLSEGLRLRGLGGLGKVLAAFFAIMCIGGSFGGGNMFQVNQAYQIFNTRFPIVGLSEGWIFGIVMAVLVALVIIGGIRSIARVTDKIVPFMVAIYVIAALIIIFGHIDEVPQTFALIFNSAFTSSAVAGGFIGVLIQGFRRAAFSNEAGIGSAPIAHSAVRTENPVSEGLVALLEPFIDTVVVCTMTALVIVITGNYLNTDVTDGITITSSSFGDVIAWFPDILAFAVMLFAFSTMISWSYYGLQSWKYLFGKTRVADLSYKVLFCGVIILGAAMDLQPVVGFSDAMIFAMCFPNIFGMYMLMPVVRDELNKYIGRIRSGEIIKR